MPKVGAPRVPRGRRRPIATLPSTGEPELRAGDLLAVCARGTRSPSHQGRILNAVIPDEEEVLMGPVRDLDAELSRGPGEIVLSLFGFFRASQGQPPPLVPIDPAARVRTYKLEDPILRHPNLNCFEYDLVFDVLPSPVEQVATTWILAALAAGSTAAWFAFEGSFSFDDILTAEGADQVYAVGDSAMTATAGSAMFRASASWRRTVSEVAVRNGLRIDSGKR